MARRGDKLREHILWVAKDVFLEMGFARASMDVVASRAETSKRSLYPHFESKEKLFLAFVELVRGLGKLKMPGDYSEKPAEALVMFCSRYLEMLLYEGSIRMCRVSMAEAARFPEGAAQYSTWFSQRSNHASARISRQRLGGRPGPVPRRRRDSSARFSTHDSHGPSLTSTSWLRPSTTTP